MLLQADKDQWALQLSSVEGIPFLTVMKWAAVRGNQLPKIGNVQVYASCDPLSKDSVILCFPSVLQVISLYKCVHSHIKQL